MSRGMGSPNFVPTVIMLSEISIPKHGLASKFSTYDLKTSKKRQSPVRSHIMDQKMKSAKNGQIGGENNFGRVLTTCIFLHFRSTLVPHGAWTVWAIWLQFHGHRLLIYVRRSTKYHRDIFIADWDVGPRTWSKIDFFHFSAKFDAG